MESSEEQRDPFGEPRESRKPWIPMNVQFLGRLGDLVLSGGGKPLISLGDPGEPIRKPSGDPG